MHSKSSFLVSLIFAKYDISLLTVFFPLPTAYFCLYLGRILNGGICSSINKVEEERGNWMD
jgi:hypothetical protein